MPTGKAITGTKQTGWMLSLPARIFLHTALIIFLGTPLSAFCQDLPDYDEISVYLDMPEAGGGEIDALIRGTELYLPVTDLFDFLKIKNTSSAGFETITGFFVEPGNVFSIDRSNNKIEYQGNIFNLNRDDIIRTETNLYLRAQLYGTVFGLDCKFNFRALSVTIRSKLELPLIREMKQEKLRNNIERLKGEVKADTTIGRTHPVMKFGMADWLVYSSQELNGKSDLRTSLSLGAMLAGGEATASLYYNSSEGLQEKQQYYLWRYVNNDFAPLRQILAGKIAANSISSIFNPVIGVQLTNTPTTYRRSFGTYTLSDRTDPGWIVELYINNVLVYYVKADASGFFTFEVPLVYGNSMVRLRFFGPWGEERTREQNITIPYNFLPEKTFEYTLSAGIVEDTMKSRFSRAIFNYGLTRSITIGGGAEYLSSLTSQPVIPYLNASVRLTNNLLLSGEYAHGVRAKGTLSYRLPSNLQLDLNYTLYNKEQKAIFYNYREERKASLTVPLRFGRVSTFQRLSVYQIVLPQSVYTTGEWLISGSLAGVNTNITTYALMLENAKPYLYGNVGMWIKLPAGFVLIPQVQYGYTEGRIFSAKAGIEKHLLQHGFLNLSYEQNFRNNFRMAELGFRYDFSFAQAGASVRQSNNRTSIIEYARGSLINDRKTKYLGTDNRPNVGRGGISIVPFLDLNANGRKDRGEPKVNGLNLRSSSGRIEKSTRDTTIRILGLEPYTNCFIELDPGSFENISWQLPKRTYNVVVDPDILKLVEIPVNVAGEATGRISLESGGETAGIGRIIVNVTTDDSKLIGKSLTEDDGYFSYMGLAPGNYIVSIDTVQLRKLGMTSDPISRSFKISASIDGDVVEGLDFLLKSAIEEAKPAPPAVTEKEAVIKRDTTYTILHEMSEVVYTISEDSWAIQIGAFKQRSLAENFRRMLERNLGKKVEITIAGEYFRVRILDLPTRKEVDENVVKLNKLGFKELWIIKLLARQQERLLVTREDSLAGIREIRKALQEPSDTSEMIVQLGAFRRKSNAVAMLERLSTPFGKNIAIVYEDGYYKVRVTMSPLIRETVLEELRRLTPGGGRLTLKDIWILPLKTGPVKESPVRIVENAPVPVSIRLKIPALSKDVRPVSLVKNNASIQAPLPEPTIALQVGIFHKEAQALRAQRKITARLDLPVEIVRQFDYYHVIITGFFTREETYRYYPELAGLGFPGITLLENYRSQK